MVTTSQSPIPFGGTPATITERVAKGAALLDAKRPRWEHDIGLAWLDLSSPCRCILGQLFGEGFNDGPCDDSPYACGLAEVGVPARVLAAAEYGFDTLYSDAEYDHLTAEWKRLITARREAGRS